MAWQDWDEHYAGGPLPWDDGAPDPLLVEALDRGEALRGERRAGAPAGLHGGPAGSPWLPRGRALDLGCGAGTSAILLASQGYTVVGVDFAPTAVARARARAAEAGVPATFQVADVLRDPLPEGPFDLVLDRGCLHVFDDGAEQARFAAQVASVLAPGGRWLCLAGSTEGPARDRGPPRRSALDLVRAIEPHLEILELRRASFTVQGAAVAAWSLLSGPRATPAQPSSRR